MADEGFTHPRLAAFYDIQEGQRDDLDPYVAVAADLQAATVVDIGCGTGVLALMLTAQGIHVIAVDPALASLDIAKAKPGADTVRWIHGDARDLPPLQADLAVMTGNVAQAITDPADWAATLAHTHAALRPGGTLMFETRIPARKAWLDWNREQTHQVLDGTETWVDLLDVDGPLVTFRWTTVFPDGERLTSTSTLRFREREQLEADLTAQGFTVTDVRDAPDRPGREFVFLATKSA
ncbi:bifunctional 2-polyprenyl-6-hydroxyphenol methylase/3-demethylubiquinol 3-O-methyltransferase UbiG [Kutzneria sp. 744]|uniref:class I SAM-dependent methyltransferase n=1 Tax=Kutzneria sp. (strain 744) TaxID=345341 RepID=UPI0003EEB9FC|nr:class I SAM-dependent methyltransferase [Kutzneria sp. 744]EWM17301.1 methyltransferase type 12 [Kutzneria sp. 744]